MSTTGKQNIKNINIWRLNNMLLNNQQITEEIKKEVRICIETNENEKMTTPKPMGFSKSSAKGKVHSNTSLTSRNEKNQINNLTLHLKQLEKEEMKNSRVSRRKGIIKIRAEVSEKETKETIAKINKVKS